MRENFKRTKIMATIGPATWSETNGDEMIEKFLAAGVDICRLNFSHGSFPEKEKQIQDIRSASDRLGKHVAIVQDLQGPKIRLGDVKDNSLMVRAGDELVLDYALKDSEHDGGATIPLQYNLADKVKIGETIYINDGKVKTEVVEVPSETAIKVKVVNGGELARKKGLNLPDTDFGNDIFPEKDLVDLEFGHDKGFDFVALSFVQNADTVRQARAIMREKGYPENTKIIAKIETKQATKDDETIEEIAREADVVMVARGDMAYEVGMEAVPTIQRKLISACRRNGKQVIVATQTMGTMYDNPIPTRAEADNVATAVIEGADAIMLSEETAVGEYPMETIEALKKIIMYTQDNNKVDSIPAEVNAPVDMVCKTAVKMAEQLNVEDIIAETKTGWTTRRVSANRPRRRIISVTDDVTVARQLAMCYGVDSYTRSYEHNYGTLLAEELRRDGKLAPDVERPMVVVVSGRDKDIEGGSDTIQLRMI